MSKEQRDYELVDKYLELRDGVIYRKEHVDSRGRVFKARPAKGSFDKDSYLQLNVGGQTLKEHRVMYMLAYKRPIKEGYEINHDNGKRADNRIENLTEMEHWENNQSKQIHTDGHYVGTTFCKISGKWKAQIRVSGKHYYLGLFDTQLQAYDAYVKKWCEVYDAA